MSKSSKKQTSRSSKPRATRLVKPPARKLEGDELLARVKTYQPVKIKGYTPAF